MHAPTKHDLTNPVDAARMLQREATLRYAQAPALTLTYGENMAVAASAAAIPFDTMVAADAASVAVTEGTARVFTLIEALADGSIAQDVAAALREDVFSDDRACRWIASVAENIVVIAVPSGAARTVITIDGEAALHNIAPPSTARVRRVLLLVGENAHVDVLDTHAGAGFLGALTQIIARAGAKVTYAVGQSMTADAMYASYLHTHVADGASVAVGKAHGGAAYARVRIATQLDGDAATFVADTGVKGDGARVFDYHCQADHDAPRAVSRLRAVAALDDTAKAVLRALTRIPAHATGADARQRMDALLLAERAEANAVPQLEIGTDEVACSHAAAVGRPSAEAAFFLQSRGLSAAEARAALVNAGFDRLFTDLPMDAAAALRTILHIAAQPPSA